MDLHNIYTNKYPPPPPPPFFPFSIRTLYPHIHPRSLSYSLQQQQSACAVTDCHSTQSQTNGSTVSVCNYPNFSFKTPQFFFPFLFTIFPPRLTLLSYYNELNSAYYRCIRNKEKNKESREKSEKKLCKIY